MASALPVEVLEPVLRGALVVPAVPAPFGLDRETIRELPDQPVARHDSAGEIMLRDPVVLVVRGEPIRRVPVAEDMDEHASVRLEAIAHPLQQRPPVGHVLEHFDGNHAVEPAGGSKSFMSAVTTSRLESARARATPADGSRAANASSRPT